MVGMATSTREDPTRWNRVDTPYMYTPLRGDGTFRLLRLEPGCDTEPINISISANPIDSGIAFDAVSYVWGPPEFVESAWVGNTRIGITKNLHTLLRHLRSSDSRCLWIDALCINQKDDSEKSKQVAMMGQIFEQAESVICWLGELFTHRLWALRFLEKLGEGADAYIDLAVDHLADIWTLIPDRRKAKDLSRVVADARRARVDEIYTNEWFERLWIVQEVTLAKTLTILCGTYEMPWKPFELATRVLHEALGGRSLKRRAANDDMQELGVAAAFQLLLTRGRFRLNNRAEDVRPWMVQPDPQWSVGRVAWHMKNRGCKEDIDRVYAFASLTTMRALSDLVPDETLGSMMLGRRLRYKPATFVPDYAQTVEWAYSNFWQNFGGFTSLCHAGLAHRKDHGEMALQQIHLKGEEISLPNTYLPSWAPELRSQYSNDWTPMFSVDYSASIAPQYKSESNKQYGHSSLSLRGFRFDHVAQTFGFPNDILTVGNVQFVELIRLRSTLREVLSTCRNKHETYPNKSSWTQALGTALLCDMPEQSDHPFQLTLTKMSLPISLSDEKLGELWQLFHDLILSDTGAIWLKMCALQRKKVTNILRPFRDFPREGQYAWVVYMHLCVVLNTHLIILTERGYLGLGTPNTKVGDVILLVGGPGVPFVARDVPQSTLQRLRQKDLGQDDRTVEDELEPVSQLLGPCYLHGIMNAECSPIQFDGNKLDKELLSRFEWEQDVPFSYRPKTTLTLL